MRILITGGAGFIGSHLSRALLWRGDDVVAIDNFYHYYPRKCKEFNVDLTHLASHRQPRFFDFYELSPVYKKLESYYENHNSKRGSFTFIEGDIVDQDFLNKIFENNRFDAVIHLAAMAGVPYSTKNPKLYTQVNINGTVNLLELCREKKVPKFIFGSSSSVYGNREDKKVTEEDLVNKSVSIYGASKASGELICHAYHQLFGIKVIVARIFGPIYGPLQRPFGMFHQRAINYVYSNKSIKIYGKHGLDTAKDSTYIDDQVKGLILCLDSDFDFEIFNLGTSDPLPIKTWIDTIEKACGKKISLDFAEMDKSDVVSSADITKARRLLGYAPKMEMNEGVRRQIEIFNLMPEWYQKMETV